MVSANSTADRAIEILLLFSHDRPVLSAAAIADRFGMSKSTTYRYLSSLRAQGFLVERLEGFGLGYRIFDLAAVARRNYGILDVAGGYLSELSRRLGETVLLTQRVEEGVVILNSWESSHPLRISYEQNRGLPFPIGASSKVFLAYASAKDREKSLSILSRSMLSAELEDLRRQLDETRLKGYAVNRGEIDDGVAAIAVPILSGPNRTQYAVSIVAPMSRLDVDRADTTIDALKTAAANIEDDWSRVNI